MSSHNHTAMAPDSTSLAEVGTRGTIGFLVSQEIEYYRNHETHQQKSPHKSRKETKDTAFSNIGSGNKKKKSNKAVGGGFLPSICSAVEISNAGGGAGYMNLRTDCDKFMQD